jgi:hypothetical protein
MLLNPAFINAWRGLTGAMPRVHTLSHIHRGSYIKGIPNTLSLHSEANLRVRKCTVKVMVSVPTLCKFTLNAAESLLSPLMAKECSASYGNRRFITTFTKA